MERFDFSGWATRNDILCGDGRTIRKNAFKDNDGQTVPLVWNHDHTNQDAVLGHALLENRDDGVYAYCKFNDTEQGKHAKSLVENGDVRSLSIYANKLKQIGTDVIHGSIRELSLVLAGANPGATIDFVMAHGDEEEDSVYANYDENAIVIYHSETSDEDTTVCHSEEKEEDSTSEEKEKDSTSEETKKTDEAEEKTVQEVIDSMNEEQRNVMFALVGQAAEDSSEEDENEDEKINHSEGGYNTMKDNVFDQNGSQQVENVISHSEMMAVITDAKKHGTMKESALAHGITQIDYMFPEARTLNNPPAFISRDMGWVTKVMKGVHHTPFSRIKSLFADITETDARARGYMKGKQKKEEVFSLLKRTTSPQTIYKLQKMDRDDVIDITDFDVVAWLKSEMRLMLDEEIARAVLVGDGRLADSDDKIKEDFVRPIWKDEDLYSIKSTIEVEDGATMADIASEFIDQAIRAKEDYAGSGSTTMFMAESLIAAAMLLKDGNGVRIYKDVKELATAMMVNEIVGVPVMKNLTRTDKQGKTRRLWAIEVNLIDYNVGADKGGAVNMFDDFDIDFNKYAYLIETRCSGALIKPKSAIVYETEEAAG